MMMIFLLYKNMSKTGFELFHKFTTLEMNALNKSPKPKQFLIGKVKMPLLKILFFIELNLRLTSFRLT